jgi:uncharacterized protein
MINPDKLKEIEEFVEKNSAEREWLHTQQIRPIAAELAEKEGADKEVVDIAVLFHDIGKKSGKPHEFESERIAREFLEKLGIDKEFIQKVCDAVRRHAGPWKEDAEMPQTIEDKVVFDADMIQQRSPFGIVKQLDDFKNWDFVDRIKKSRDQLRKAHDLIITKSGKEMVEDKMEYIEKFFEEVLK